MRAIRYSFRGLLIALVVLELVLVLVLASVLVQRVVGYSVLVVQGDSMGDSYPLGSVAFTRTVAADDVKVGDVVGIRTTHDELGVLHRVIEIERADGQILAYTKGDSNGDADAEPTVLPAQVQLAGGHLPYVGYLLGIVLTPAGWMVFMILPGAAFAGLAVLRIWRAPLAKAEWATA
jgi:signal peptidase I